MRNFWKEMAILQLEKLLYLNFLVLLSVTNLKELLMSVQEVFWRLLRKLEDHFCNT